MSEPSASASEIEVSKYIRLLSSEHTFVHGEAFAWLAAHPTESRPVLLEMANRREPYPLVLAVFHILGQIGDAADVSLLADILNGADPKLVWDSAQALARHPASQAMDVLLSALTRDDPAVVEAAAVALGVRGNDAVRPHLERLLNHPRETVRYRTIYALGQIGIAPSESVLREHLKHERSEEIRKFIKESLA
jgi:HEAT repeat protein